MHCLPCHSLGELVECHLLHAGWLDRKCLGWLGQLHCFSFACLWEWAGCAGSCGFLGSSWARFGWQRSELWATSSDWVEAWSHFYARNDGIYYTGNHRQIPWLLVSFCWLEVCRCAQWSCRNLQSASSRLGSDFGLHGLLRSFSGPVWRNSCFSWWLWMEAHHIYWSGGQEKKAQCRVGKRKTGDDGHHWHVLSGDG